MDTTRMSLIEGVQASDPAALKRFAAFYQQKIHDWAFHFTQDQDLASDVSQDVWVRILEKIPSFDWTERRQGGFRKWLKAITRNIFLDLVKKEHWTRFDSAALATLVVESAISELDSQIDKEHERRILMEAMEQLRDRFPDECAIVDDLGWGDNRTKNLDGQTPKAVAKRHGKTVDAVIKIKSRLMERLRKRVFALRDQIN